LFDSRGYIKLSDFGFAKVVPDRTFTLCGTPEYLAPEIILNVGHGRPVDWWTLGVLLYEFLAGIDPFADKDTLSIYENILKCRLKFPKQFDKNAKSLVKHLLVSDLSKRYGNTSQGSQAIREHRFF
jgi:serine/threonine protein kinase